MDSKLSATAVTAVTAATAGARRDGGAGIPACGADTGLGAGGAGTPACGAAPSATGSLGSPFAPHERLGRGGCGVCGVCVVVKVSPRRFAQQRVALPQTRRPARACG